jgi:expansin (peptidoglycan-binding protein)
LVVSFQGVVADGRRSVSAPSPAVAVPAGRSASTTDTLVFSLCSAQAVLPIGSLDSASIVVVLDTTDAHGKCDASQPSVPTLGAITSYGDVTTYGGVDSSLTSSGGACNYGETGIHFYAAIQVDLLPGDAAGQWREGRACGQGARVRAHTPQGVKETYVRIMDKCPDPHCGIDLGGAPAAAIMGVQAGRYQGEWTFVSCKGHPELFDGPSHLWTKEGTSAFWSLVQVRNPWTAVAALRWKPVSATGSDRSDMPWATEAENFFKVPAALLTSTDSIDLLVRYVDSTSQTTRLAPSDLALPQASYLLSPSDTL